MIEIEIANHRPGLASGLALSLYKSLIVVSTHGWFAVYNLRARGRVPAHNTNPKNLYNYIIRTQRTMLQIEDREVDKRNAGCGAFIGDHLYIWGGMCLISI